MIFPSEHVGNKRYVVKRKLGKGGFGEVWLAGDKLLHRDVALKALVSKEDSAERLSKRRERALIEARTLAKLHHPAIVRIHDLIYVGRDKDPWIVMGYFPGESLDKVLLQLRQPMPAEDVIDFAQPVLSGLMEAHRNKIIHRDVKPHNILIADDGSVCLVDFGIAKAIDASTFTSAGIQYGSLPYMSPEQVEGNQPPAPPTDIWSLGVVLYHVLQGSCYSPFLREGSKEATINAIFNHHPPRPQRGGPLADMVMAMLHKNPASRPRAEEVADTLRQAKAVAYYESQPVQPFDPRPGGPHGTVPNGASRLESMPPAEAAIAITRATPRDAIDLLLQSSNACAARVLDHCENSVTGDLITGVAMRDRDRAGAILEIFDAPRAGRILDNMDKHAIAAVLPVISPGPILREAHELTGSNALSTMHPKDAAQVVADIDEDLAAALLRRAAPRKVAAIIRQVSSGLRARLMQKFSPDFRALVQRFINQPDP